MYDKVQHNGSYVASVTLIVYRNVEDFVDSLISWIDGKLLMIGGYNKIERRIIDNRKITKIFYLNISKTGRFKIV